MDSNNITAMQNQLRVAYRELQNNQPKLALDLLKKIQLAWPKSSDAAHLLALTYKALGDTQQSRNQFILCLDINQNQPEVHNNLANLLKSEGDYVAANEHYHIALKLNPRYLQAWRNLAICQQAQSDFENASKAFNKALELSPNDVSALNGLADCYRATEDFKAAKEAYQRVLALDPKRVNAWHNLGLNLHLQGELAQALECYQTAYDLAPNGPEVTQSLALCLNETGATLDAIALFERALTVHYQSLELHERFNGMLWESEYADRFGESYHDAISRVSDKSALVLSYASLLFRAGQVEQAKSVLQQASSSTDNDLQLLSLRGKIEAELGNYDLAYQSLSLSLQREFSRDTAHQLIKIDIVLARYEDAQTLLTRVFSDAPSCQLTWAFQSLVWRLTVDERYHWLNNYDEFVKIYKIETPPQYATLEEFLVAVGNALNPLHRNEREPLLQTLRNGTQTAPRLLNNPDPVIKLLKQALQTIVERYISELPNDDIHPLLARKSDSFEFSGSWSVKLRSGGFHINHVHTDGWLSSSCYISIPDSMQEPLSQSGTDKSGYIKFGESPLCLGEREVIEKSVRPEPGMVVLFPSYCWHGTFSFNGNQSDYRLTAPFDIVPN